MFPPPLPLSNSYVWKRKSKSCLHETFLFKAEGDRSRSPRKFAELSCEWEQWLQFLTQKAGNVLADKVCKEANGSWKYWSRNYVTTWSLLCDGGSGRGRWHHRWTQGAKERRASIPSWSGPDLPWRKHSLSSCQHLHLPWILRTVPHRPTAAGPIPGVTVLNSKLRNKNLVLGATIHLCCVFLPNSVTTHLHVICSLISTKWPHRKLSCPFQSRNVRRRTAKTPHNSSQVEGGSCTLHLGDVC